MGHLGHALSCAVLLIFFSVIISFSDTKPIFENFLKKVGLLSMHNVGHNMLNVCQGPNEGLEMPPTYMIKILCLEMIYRTLGREGLKKWKIPLPRGGQQGSFSKFNSYLVSNGLKINFRH